MTKIVVQYNYDNPPGRRHRRVCVFYPKLIAVFISASLTLLLLLCKPELVRSVEDHGSVTAIVQDKEETPTVLSTGVVTHWVVAEEAAKEEQFEKTKQENHNQEEEMSYHAHDDIFPIKDDKEENAHTMRHHDKDNHDKQEVNNLEGKGKQSKLKDDQERVEDDASIIQFVVGNSGDVEDSPSSLISEKKSNDENIQDIRDYWKMKRKRDYTYIHDIPTKDAVYNTQRDLKKKQTKKPYPDECPPPCSKQNHLCTKYIKKGYSSRRRCREGKDFDKKCKHDSECFSGSCNTETKKCWCPTPMHCFGCNNNNVPCLRLEHWSHPIEFCTIEAQSPLIVYKKPSKGGNIKYYREDLKLFDVGATHSETYEHMEYMIKSSTSKCLTVSPYQNSTSVLNLPPAFIQSNVLVKKYEDIGLITLIGPYDSFKEGTHIWIDNTWITTISKDDVDHLFILGTNKGKSEEILKQDWKLSSKSKGKKAKKVALSKEVYPKQRLDSMTALKDLIKTSSHDEIKGKLYIVSLHANAKSPHYLDFDIPDGLAVDIVGVEAEVHIDIIGVLTVFGRLSFKNIRISFLQGSLDIQAPLLFHSSKLFDLERCPTLFKEFDGSCYYVSDMIEQADDAITACEEFDRGSLALPDAAQSFALAHPEDMPLFSNSWVHPIDGQLCTFIDPSGNIVSPDTSEYCEIFTPIICSAALKQPITGKKYTSYNSDQFIGTYSEDLYKRIVDKARLPYQSGGTLSFIQNDLSYDNESSTNSSLSSSDNKVEFMVPDSFPEGISVHAEMKFGNTSDVQVALDTMANIGNLDEEWYLNSTSTSHLPTKMQIHLVADSEVCIETVKLLVHNETGSTNVAFEFPAKLVAECADFNICSASDKRLCGRSLMYYDEEHKCAWLKRDVAAVPRDLSLDLLASNCARLTTWNHPKLGSPFLVEIDAASLSQPVEIAENTITTSHRYRFHDLNNQSFKLRESTQIPVDLIVKGEDSQIRSLRISRYNVTISEVDFISLWDCINMCDAVGDEMDGIVLSPVNATEITLDMIALFECKKLVNILTAEGDGREACTSPAVEAKNLQDIIDNWDFISSKTSKFRTLLVNITGRLGFPSSSRTPMTVITIPENRGLSLFQDDSFDGSIESGTFIVGGHAELYVSDLLLNDAATFLIERLGWAEITGCEVSMTQRAIDNDEMTNTTFAFLQNNGTVYLDSTRLDSKSRILNDRQGIMEIMYSEFEDKSSIINYGDIRLSRMQVHDDFTFTADQSQSKLSQFREGGILRLPDAKRFYETVADEETDPSCNGNDQPDIVLDLEIEDCKDECEKEFLCSGILYYFLPTETEFLPKCGMCLQEEPCMFNCSSVSGGAYFKPSSRFDYAKVTACPFFVRPFETFINSTLEECKLYCSYYETCEGFSFEIDDKNGKIETRCEMIGDLDLSPTCAIEDASEFYIPYIPDSTDGFIQVPGSINAKNKVAQHENVTFDECSFICTKTLSCASFIADDNGSCELFSNNYFSNNPAIPQSKKHFVSVDETFPKKRYMTYEQCSIDSPYVSSNTKSLERCKNLCNNDYSCAGFAYKPIESLTEKNCHLYRIEMVIDGTFGPQSLACEGNFGDAFSLHVAYVTESYIEQLPSNNKTFSIVWNEADLFEDECKSLCFYYDACVALRYSSERLECEIGTLVDIGQDIVNNDGENGTYLALKNVQSDTLGRYSRIDSCFKSEKLSIAPPTDIETPSGFIKFSQTCTSVGVLSQSTNNNKVQSPAECALDCQLNSSCIGFMFYVDHGGSDNIAKIGTCEQIESFDIVSCDGHLKNTDLYINGEKGGFCEATCNIHQLCSAFVFNDGICNLYSDISLVETCTKGDEKQAVHVGLTYMERDALVDVTGQCFTDFEDLQLLPGCYAFNQSSSVAVSGTMMTPLFCQQYCKERGKKYYAVTNGDSCSCSVVIPPDNLSSSSPDNYCNQTCTGDNSQECGGVDYAKIGTTDLPLYNLTISQCKSECFLSGTCQAIIYDDHYKDDDELSNFTSTCELRSRSEFDACKSSSLSRGESFIQSLEHFYMSPRSSYLGSTSILNLTTELKQDCQRVCDVTAACEAIRYLDDTTTTTSAVVNCELLGGGLVYLPENEVTENLYVANDVTLFTRGFEPDENDRIVTFSQVFDLDECRALCEQHVQCGSILFESRTCKLYKKTSFAVVSNNYSSSNHYIDYNFFIDPAQEFIHASQLCVDQTTNTTVSNLLATRSTVQSVHDCAHRCNTERTCESFNYEEEEVLTTDTNFTQGTCSLFGTDSPLTHFCDNANTNEELFVMFNRAKFTEAPDACLINEDIDYYTFEGKSIYECAALCDKWFNCRSFRFDEFSGRCRLFENEQFSKENCNDNNSVGDGKLFLYFSDYFYARLDSAFCIGSIAFAVIENAPIEACKSACDKHVDCLSFEHNQAGTCAMYSSTDFSGNCTVNNSRDLYISYKDIIEPSSRYLFSELDTCFAVGTSVTSIAAPTIDECKESCSEDDNCFGIQYTSSTNECFILGDSSLETSQCPTETKAQLKTEVNPYKTFDKTCLRNKIDLPSKILDKDEYECMALCNAHPLCRYFLHGKSPSVADPQLRECILFSAQAEELDDCDDYNASYAQMSAVVNGRTFIDQITWFDEPERTLASLSSLTYQECASLCDSLSNCNAFIHTWNYRRFPATARPLIFQKTRLMRADFNADDSRLLFLQFGTSSSRNGELILAPASSNDDVKRQSVILELDEDSDGDTVYKLKFWSASGKCVSGGSYSTLEENSFVRNVIEDNFDDAIPFCQTLEVSDCDNERALKFDIDEKIDHVTLSYDWKSDANETLNGCVRLIREYEDDLVWVPDNSQSMVIPATTNCSDPVIEERVICTSTQRLNGSKSPSSSSNPSPTLSPAPSFETIFNSSCFHTGDKGVNCTYQNRTIENYFDTVETVTTCQSPPVLTTCIESNTVKNCTYSSTFNTTTCWRVQKNASDLLEEMYSEFNGKCKPTAADSSVPFVFSSSFSGGCGYDESLVKLSSERFNFVSDAVKLQSNKDGRCLSGLDLHPCEVESTVSWVYVFQSGHLFYDDSGMMKCLSLVSDISSDGLEIRVCDHQDQYQRWTYNGDDSTLSIQHDSKTCLTSEGSSAALGSCTLTVAKWSQFTECKLNSREYTKPMAVESIDNPGQCISENGEKIVSCNDSTGRGQWKYIYDGSKPVLQSTATQRCLGRVTDDYETFTGELKDLPTGLVPCNKYTHSRISLGGESGNVLQWSEINLTSGKPIDPFYCITYPQPMNSIGKRIQKVCADDLTKELTWRKYGSGSDATEISVKPSAALQAISDPEVLFQFYLYSVEGRQSRILRSNTAKLVRLVERAKSNIVKTTNIVEEALTVLDTTIAPLDQIEATLQQTSSTFKAFSLIIRPIEYIPYVGPVVRSSRIRPITSQVGKRLNKGSSLVDRVSNKIGAASTPIITFKVFIQSVNDAIQSVSMLESVVDAITRSSFCGFRSGMIDHYEKMAYWISLLARNVALATNLLKDIDKLLSPLNDFRAKIKANVFNPINKFKSILSPLRKLADSLGFLKTIASFEICLPKPRFTTKKIDLGLFSITIPWIDFYGKACASLNDIGDVLKSIEMFIKKIPLVGQLWSLVEKAVESIVSGIFKKIGIELPTFSFNTPFLDDLERVLDKSKAEMQKVIDQFNAITDLGDTFDASIFQFTENIFDAIPRDIFDCISSLSLSNSSSLQDSCVFDGKIFPNLEFGVLKDLLSSPNILDPLYGISDSLFDHTDFVFGLLQQSIKTLMPSISDVWLDVIKQLPQAMEDMVGNLNGFLDAGFKCLEWKPMQVNFLDSILTSLNMTEEELGIPSCPIEVNVCTRMDIPDFAILGGWKDRILDLFNESRRRLGVDIDSNYDKENAQRFLLGDEACKNMGDFMVSIPVPTPKTFYNNWFGGRFFKLLDDKNWGSFIFNLKALSPTLSINLQIGCKDEELQAIIPVEFFLSFSFSYDLPLKRSRYLEKICDKCMLSSFLREVNMIEDIFFGQNEFGERDLRVGQMIHAYKMMTESPEILKSTINAFLSLSKVTNDSIIERMSTAVRTYSIPSLSISDNVSRLEFLAKFIDEMREKGSFYEEWDNFIDTFKFIDGYGGPLEAIANMQENEIPATPIEIRGLLNINHSDSTTFDLLKRWKVFTNDKDYNHLYFFIELFGGINLLSLSTKAKRQDRINRAWTYFDSFAFNPKSYPSVDYGSFVAANAYVKYTNGQGRTYSRDLLPYNLLQYAFGAKLNTVPTLTPIKYIHLLYDVFSFIIKGPPKDSKKRFSTIDDVFKNMKQGDEQIALAYRPGINFSFSFASMKINLMRNSELKNKRLAWCFLGDNDPHKGRVCFSINNFVYDNV